MDHGGEGRPRVLVVDDDEATRTMLRRLLDTEGYAVDEASNGPAALEKAAATPPDLVLLDIVMPGQDGLEVLKGLRHSGDVPVILLTGMGDEADRVLGLRFGADDYVVKPFSIAELTARMEAVLRRSPPARARASLDFDGLRIDLTNRAVTVRGGIVDFPPQEYELLAFLASSPGQTFTREQLLDKVWPHTADRGVATVTEHIGRLRRRIEEVPDRPRWVRTVRGVGYRFEP